jgi:RNA polymerase sigma-70 factor (ECF subfamily)
VDITKNIVQNDDPAWDWAGLRRSCLSEARRVLRDPYEAEDAVQEALIRAWRQRDRCRDRQAPVPWLRRIARNEALRLIERRPGVMFTELQPDSAGSDTRETSDTIVDRLSVWQALARLEPEERNLVTLHYVLDLPNSEIASRLGLAEATVRVRLHRIRKRLDALMVGFV